MLDTVRRALALSEQTRDQTALAQLATSRVALLTPRENQVLEHLVAGHSNKIIAYELAISPRTIEIHRGHLMQKMQARGLSNLIQMALVAGVGPPARRR